MKRIREVHFDHYSVHYGIRSHIGEIHSGDDVCCIGGDDFVLLGIIDGLGHGKKAADIAVKVRKYIERYHTNDLRGLVEDAHHHFMGSQGASVGFVKVYDDARVEFVGLGNVMCKLINTQTKEHLSLLSKDGALGVRKRNISAVEAILEPNTILILYSDGISNEIIRNDYRWPSSGSKYTINDILLKYGKAHDDASFVYLNRKKANGKL